jgi:3-mercaptopyruvate sulfurtransferase SseA
VAQKMKDIGLSDVYVLKGGWKAWVMFDYPVDPI